VPLGVTIVIDSSAFINGNLISNGGIIVSLGGTPLLVTGECNLTGATITVHIPSNPAPVDGSIVPVVDCEQGINGAPDRVLVDPPNCFTATPVQASSQLSVVLGVTGSCHPSVFTLPAWAIGVICGGLALIAIVAIVTGVLCRHRQLQREDEMLLSTGDASPRDNTSPRGNKWFQERVARQAQVATNPLSMPSPSRPLPQPPMIKGYYY